MRSPVEALWGQLSGIYVVLISKSEGGAAVLSAKTAAAENKRELASQVKNFILS